MTFPILLLDRYRRLGWSDGLPGEWGFITDQTRRSLRALLDAGDKAGLAEYFANVFRSPLCAGLISFDWREVAKPEGKDLFVRSMIENVKLWSQYTDEGDLSILSAPEAGMPMLADVDGTRMMFDAPRHDHYAQVIAGILPDGGTVMEIGGGYGGFALQLLRRRPDARVVICDLPETLYVSWYWLAGAGVDVGWWDEPRKAVTLLPAQTLPDFGDTPDVVFSAHALGEMDRATAQSYVRWAQDRAVRWIFLDTPHARLTGASRTAVIYPETMARELAPDPACYREVYRAPTTWPGTGDRYWEWLYERRT